MQGRKGGDLGALNFLLWSPEPSLFTDWSPDAVAPGALKQMMCSLGALKFSSWSPGALHFYGRSPGALNPFGTLYMR